MRRVLRRWWVWLVLLPGIGLLALFVWGSWLPALRLARYREALGAQGEKLEVERCTPRLVPQATAAAQAFMQATYRIANGKVALENRPAAMVYVPPGKARVAWTLRALEGSKSVTNTWEELGEDLARNAAGLEAVRQACRAEGMQWNLDYRQGAMLLLPHLAVQKRTAQWLLTSSLFHLHSRALDASLVDIESLVRLTRGLESEPLLISQLVRIAIGSMAYAATWEALQAPGWTDAQLASIQELWGQTSFLPGMVAAMQMERAMGLSYFTRLRANPGQIAELFDMNAGPFAGQAAPTQDPAEKVSAWAGQAARGMTTGATGLFWRWFGSNQDELLFLESMQQGLDSGRRAAEDRRRPVRSGAEDSSDEGVFGGGMEGSFVGWRLRYMLSSMLLPAWDKAFDKAIRLEAERELLVAALAIHRYQLRHGQPPATLDALVPEFLERVPRDWMNGEALRYRRLEAGDWLVYSVGENGIDDGGSAAPVKAESPIRTFFAATRDLPWPLAATAEEVAAAEVNRPRR